MTDIAELGFRVDSNQAVKATADLDRLGDQAAITERQVVSAGTSSSRALAGAAQSAEVMGGAFGRLGRFAGGSTAQIQNAAFQIGDFATQVGAGSSAVVALGQQLPQFLGGFGAVGAIFGTVAAIAVPLAGSFLTMADNTDSLSDRLDDLAGTVDAYREAAELARQSTIDLAAEYGVLAVQAGDALRAISEVGRVQALRELDSIVSSISTQFGTFTNVISDTGMTLEDNLGSTIREIASTFDVTRAQAVELAAAFREIGEAEGPAAQAAALGAVSEAIKEASGGVDEMTDAAIAVVSELDKAQERALALAVEISNGASSAEIVAGTDMAGTIGAAADEAARLADNMAGSAAAWAAFNAARAMAELPPGMTRGDGITSIDIEGGNIDDYLPPELPAFNAPRFSSRGSSARRGRRGGGGGMSEAEREAQRQQNEMTREAERIFEATRTAAERYASEIEDLNELHQMGYIDAETFGRAVDQLDADMREASFEQVQRGIESISDAFANAIVNGEDMGEALGQVFRQMAADILSAGIQQALEQVFQMPGATGGAAGAGGGFGGFLSTLFGSVFGGARASGGPVTGGRAYLVGERGPEMFAPTTSGNVIPNHAIGNPPSVNVPITINNSSGAEVSAERNQQGGIDVNVTDRMIDDYFARGRGDSALRRRFGVRAKPQGV